jgi:prepilin-type processing-associated H-X9-DG protein
LIALLLPAKSSATEAALRAQCANNLRQIGLAMHNYHDKYGCFPPAYIADENGKPKHSWRVLILPFTEYGPLYKEYRFDEPWDSPHNQTLAAKMPTEYRCPTESRAVGAGRTITTSYAMIVGPHAFSDGPTGRRKSDFTDGLSNTIMIAEAAGAGINWLEPRDLDATKMTYNLSPPYDASENVPGKTKTPRNDMNSPHPLVVNTLFADGSVRNLDKGMEPKEIEALLTIDGGEDVER